MNKADAKSEIYFFDAVSYIFYKTGLIAGIAGIITTALPRAVRAKKIIKINSEKSSVTPNSLIMLQGP